MVTNLLWSFATLLWSSLETQPLHTQLFQVVHRVQGRELAMVSWSLATLASPEALQSLATLQLDTLNLMSLELHEAACLVWALGHAPQRLEGIQEYIRCRVPGATDQRALAMLGRGLLKLKLFDTFQLFTDAVLPMSLGPDLASILISGSREQSGEQRVWRHVAPRGSVEAELRSSAAGGGFG